jgi:putative transcriptional regulator
VEEKFHELFQMRHEDWKAGVGRVLIAGPFLRGEHFSRSVVYMVTHDGGGSVGFVLNKPLHGLAGELVGDLAGLDLPLYAGGPVEPSNLYYLHRRPEIKQAIRLPGGVCWGGDFGELVGLLREGRMSTREVRFFVGYSGWSAGQLQGEIEDHSWLTGEIEADGIFSLPNRRLWEDSMRSLGAKFRLWASFPVDPREN